MSSDTARDSVRILQLYTDLEYLSWSMVLVRLYYTRVELVTGDADYLTVTFIQLFVFYLANSYSNCHTGILLSCLSSSICFLRRFRSC